MKKLSFKDKHTHIWCKGQK